jgi:hypothetical protein
MSEHEFDAWLGEARESIEVDVVRERRLAVPDFAAVVAIAHEREPEAVPHAWVREVDELAPVLDLHGRDDELEIADGQLDALIGEAREVIEHDVAARRLSAIPALPRAPASGGRRWIPVLAIAAVLAGLAFAVPRMLDRIARSNVEAVPSHQSEFQQREPSDLQVLPSDEGMSTGVTSEAIVRPPPSEPAQPEVVLEPEPQPEAEPAEPESEPQAKPTASGPSLADRIARLDEKAQRLWAEGDLVGASEAFHAIVELAGRGRAADLAYGDLFTLAHQRGDQDAEAELWREYVERFPKGRFADDARAGLCRRSDRARECWTAYLDDFPDGVHRSAADRALEELP